MFVVVLLCLLIAHSRSLTTRSSIGVESQIGRSLTFNLEDKMTCLYETLEEGMIITLSLSPSLLSRFPLQMRLSSPFGEFSEWVEGEEEAKLKHNVTETGDYEICIVSARPVQVNLNIFFHDPEKVEKSFKTYLEAHQMSGNIQKTVNMIFQHVYQAYYSVKYYNKVSVRDQAMQETNSENIRAFGAVGCLATITLSISQVLIVRRMFRVDASRIRI